MVTIPFFRRGRESHQFPNCRTRMDCCA